MDAFGGSRVKPRPPERGVFPLDHDGECKPFMEIFMKCLKESKGDHFPCKSVSKTYLKCRMDKGLMAEDDLDSLGFTEGKEYVRKSIPLEETKEAKGFIAGLTVRGSNKFGFDFWNKKSH